MTCIRKVCVGLMCYRSCRRRLWNPVDLVDRVDLVDLVNLVDRVDLVGRVDLVDRVDRVDLVNLVDRVDPVDLVDLVDLVDRVDRAISNEFWSWEIGFSVIPELGGWIFSDSGAGRLDFQ